MLKIIAVFVISITLCCSLTVNSKQTTMSITNPLIQLEPLLKFIEKQIALHVKPTTFWFVDSLPGKSCFEEGFPIDFVQNGSIPVMKGNLSTAFRNKHRHFNSFIFLIEAPSTEEEVEDFAENVKNIGNRRKDKFIFMGKTKILKKVFENVKIIGLKYKYGFDCNTQEILIDPTIYTPGTMIPITDLDNWKPLPLMGQNVRGRHIRISGTLLPPWLYHISDDTSLSIEKQYDGNNFRLFLEASIRFNYTFEIYAPPNHPYGDSLPNGTWIGQVGDIHYEERNYDIAILLGHVLSWYPLVDFAGTMDFAKLMFFTSHPQLDINWEAFFNPYQISVWIYVIVFFVAMAVTMFVVLLREPKHSQSIQKQNRILRSVSIALEITFGIALEQNAKVPNRLRLLSALWMSAIFITGIGYKCNLASYLSFPSITSVPDTYQQLASRKDYKVILNVLGTAEKVFFETNESPTIKTIKKRMTTLPDPFECVTEAFINPKTVCIGWTPLMVAFTYQTLTLNTRVNALEISKDPALPVSMSIGFQKDSILVDSFTPVCNVIYESGLYSKWEFEAYYYHKVVGRQKILNETDGIAYAKLKEYEESLGMGGFRPFSFKNLQFSFLILAAGLLLSVFAIVWEILPKHFEKFKIGRKVIRRKGIRSQFMGKRILVKSQRTLSYS